MEKFKVLLDEKNTLDYCTPLFNRHVILHRIQALKDFGDVKKGDIGGYVEKEKNLSQEGNCWIYDDAKVYDKAKVFGHAKIHDYAKLSFSAQVYGNAKVCSCADVEDFAKVYRE